MIDLHCHSTVSDGMLSPAEVVRLAHQNGCTLLALTDHDHTGGIAEARAEANKLGLRFVNGVEISVTWRGRTIHGIEVTNDGLVIFPGGVLLVDKNGVIVGSVGVSGGSVDEDESVAKAGAAVLSGR